MRYGQIYFNDVANGPGCRTALFVSGCTHHCKGCFNEITWDFNYGEKYTKEVEDEIISSLSPSYVKGLTILGGEPMEICNQNEVADLVVRVRETYPDKSIWLFSGYTFEELTDLSNKRCNGPKTAEILSNIDVLVDGEFMLDKKDFRLKFRGSSNQRIIDMKRTLSENNIVISDYGKEV